MKKIESLTREQEVLLDKHKKEYLEIGLSVGETNEKLAESCISYMYRLFEKKAPVYYWADSPYDAQVKINMLKNGIDDFSNYSKKNFLSRNSIKRERDYFWGQMDAYWISLYKFGEKIGVKIKDSDLKTLNAFEDLARSCGWWYPFEMGCVIVRKPKFIGFDYDRNVIHGDGGPAVEFHDGYKIFSLWGVQVPEWLAVTHIEKLEIKKILELKNVDQRAVGLRRYTPEKLITSGIGKVIEDQWGSRGYKLIDLSSIFTKYNYAPFLYMKNPSVPGMIHCEGVDASCKTIQEALNWRADDANWIVEKQT